MLDINQIGYIKSIERIKKTMTKEITLKYIDNQAHGYIQISNMILMV